MAPVPAKQALVKQQAPAKQQAPKPPPTAEQQEDDFFSQTTGEEVGSDEEVIDLSDVDESAAEQAPIPPGVFDATLVNAEYGDSQRSGKKMITWVFEISAGKLAGRQMRYYTVTVLDSGIARLKKLLVRIAPATNMKQFLSLIHI